jgi:hypothetical protein
MLQRYFSFIFWPERFVCPPSFLHFTVEAIKVTGYNAVMNQVPAKNTTIQEQCPKIICLCLWKRNKLAYAFNFVWRITMSFFFRQFSHEAGMPYDIKIVIHTFVFYVINLLTSFVLLNTVNTLVLCCEFAKFNGRGAADCTAWVCTCNRTNCTMKHPTALLALKL